MGPPSLTKTWHHDTYFSIDPRSRPELRMPRKTVVITGGGSGIGRALAQAFADAGVARIAIIGRRLGLLQDTKQEFIKSHPDVIVTVHVADVTDESAVTKVATEIGSWDVLVSNAGYLSDPAVLVDSDPRDWWKGFEVNVGGTYNLVRSFLPKRNNGACMIGINAGSIQVAAMASKFSSYNASKFAALKVMESLAHETPDLHVVNMHPGVVASEMSAKSSRGKTGPPPVMDTPQLPGHFAVWLCSREAQFLRGKFVWSNWDVTELLDRKAEIEGTLLLTANCIGWPYSP